MNSAVIVALMSGLTGTERSSLIRFFNLFINQFVVTAGVIYDKMKVIYKI